MKISVNGAHLFVDDSGAGETTWLFLHFFGGSGRSWSEVVAQLPDFRCVTPDLRGFGDSDASVGGYSVDDNADDIAALVDERKIERFVLVGHSMGGKIALALAARRPAGLQSVLLLAPSPPTPEPLVDEERARLISGYGKREAIVQTVRSIASLPITEAQREQMVEDGMRVSRSAWRAWLECGSREDISARMGRIQVPVTVLAGECDRGMTPDLLRREVVSRIANARMSVVRGAGHLLPLETPTAVARACRQMFPSK